MKTMRTGSNLSPAALLSELRRFQAAGGLTGQARHEACWAVMGAALPVGSVISYPRPMWAASGDACEWTVVAHSARGFLRVAPVGAPHDRSEEESWDEFLVQAVKLGATLRTAGERRVAA